MTEWIVSSTVLIAAMLLLRRLLRGKVSPRLQYALWAIVLVRLLVPVSFFNSAISVQNVRENVMERPEVQQVYTAITSPIQMGNQRTEIPQNINIPEDQSEKTEQNLPENRNESPVQALPESPTAQAEQNLSAADTEQTSQTAETPDISLKEILLLVWALGMAAVAGGLVGCNIHFARRLRYTRQPLEVAYSPVDVYVTNAIETPCLFGLFRPAIYLTPDVAAARRRSAMCSPTRSPIISISTTSGRRCGRCVWRSTGTILWFGWRRTAPGRMGRWPVTRTPCIFWARSTVANTAEP